MKTLEEMSGIEKSAMLLITLGADVASKVLARLDQETIFKISQEITKLDDITLEDKEELIGEFLLDLRKNKGSIRGGENVAKDILKSAFGEDKAEEIISNFSYTDIDKEFMFINNIDPGTLASLLENEHTQTITATLFYLSPTQTAGILKNLPINLSKDIIRRMATMKKPAPRAVQETVRVIKNRYEKLKETSRKTEKTDGINILVDIMNRMNPDQEKKLMHYFENKLPQISLKIKERIFNFENILNLSHHEIRILIDELNDDTLIAKALKGAGDEIRFKFIRNMSRNRATDILDEMDRMGPVRLAEINEARNTIVRMMRLLNDNGTITIRKEQEIMIE